MIKDVILIRHGQSTFNSLFEMSGIDPLHFDAPLSSFGVEQVLSKCAAAKLLDADLVVSSPLTRALQTATGLFADGPAPIIVLSLHRERLGNSCDVGRAPSALSEDFPNLNFDHLDETWWFNGDKDERGVPVEPDYQFIQRVSDFSHWISSRPERTIVVVGHGTFFHHLTGREMKNCEFMNWHPTSVR